MVSCQLTSDKRIGVATNRWNTFLVLYNLNPLYVRKLSSTYTLEILLPSQPCDRKKHLCSLVVCARSTCERCSQNMLVIGRVKCQRADCWSWNLVGKVFLTMRFFWWALVSASPPFWDYTKLRIMSSTIPLVLRSSRWIELLRRLDPARQLRAWCSHRAATVWATVLADHTCTCLQHQSCLLTGNCAANVAAACTRYLVSDWLYVCSTNRVSARAWNGQDYRLAWDHR